ncbi:TlpA disulfide reductase family protein [uncultured Ellagibacter sp.]|uniref:TlpA family protein disulfide reductase n=1 Tax=uncultured Ellagibacter sp. TaxID=2137580 RepID=UPI00262A47EB|nr:TlpA disulfide reductase family protein [uncultured Ellagibacter sp.]
MKLTKIAVALVASLLVFALAACSSPKESEADSTSGNTDIAALLATQPKNTEEATELHQKLMQKENEILSGDSKLWEKVFLAANKDMPMIEDGKNYGDFLLDTIEGTKDQFSAEELKKLKAGAQQVKEIEDKLTALEKDFPGCGSSPGSGESVDASSAGMPSSAGAAASASKFPSFQGKDLDGNEVTSDKLFSSNKVTVVNFWFTTCKPCVGELGDLEALNKELSSKGGQVVGVNSFTLDGDATAISEAKDILSKKNITYKNIWFASSSEAGKFTSELFSYPTTYVVDKNGNIVGDPIVGAITSPEQQKTLSKLIDRAIANSEG